VPGSRNILMRELSAGAACERAPARWLPSLRVTSANKARTRRGQRVGNDYVAQDATEGNSIIRRDPREPARDARRKRASPTRLETRVPMAPVMRRQAQECGELVPVRVRKLAAASGAERGRKSAQVHSRDGSFVLAESVRRHSSRKRMNFTLTRETPRVKTDSRN